MATRAKAIIVTASAASRPVSLFVVVEVVVAGLVLVLACRAGWSLAQVVTHDGLPPWPALGWFALLGAFAYVVRAVGLITVVRRWHGIAVRRIDERWAADR
jgi:hypothetical protein